MPVLDTVLSGAPEFLPRMIIRAVSVGTEIEIIQEGIPDVIPSRHVVSVGKNPCQNCPACSS